MLYLGCPQWSSTAWKGNLLSSHCKSADMLSEYAQCFNSVEGNTSFYADPSHESLLRWHDAVPEDFKFTFKFHRRFSHELQLTNITSELNAWLNLFEPIFAKTGQIMLQLPVPLAQMLYPFLLILLHNYPNNLVTV